MDYFDKIVSDVRSANEFVDTYADVDRYIDTGSYILNALLSGSFYKGLPGNKITAFAGESSTGKTFFTLGVVGQFLKNNPDGGVIYFESESAITRKMIEERNIDSKRLIIIPVSTVQEFRHQALMVLNKYLEDKPDDRPRAVYQWLQDRAGRAKEDSAPSA